MPFVQGDYKVQALAPHRPDDAFTDRIGHGRPYRRCDDVQPHMPYTLVNVFGENRIPVVDQEAIRMIDRNGFSKLLHGPRSCGMGCDIDVQESAAPMLNDYKDIEDAEGQGDGYAEVTRHDAFGMITDKRGPALRVIAFAGTSYAVTRHVFAHGARRHLQAQRESQCIGDTQLASRQVVTPHLPDKPWQVHRNWWPSTTRFPSPEQAEPLVLPLSACLRLPHGERLLPVAPL